MPDRDVALSRSVHPTVGVRLLHLLLWLGSLLVLMTVIYVRVRLIDIPLERDEGEYAYAGKLILQGIAPYTLACNMKLPGTYLVYAGIMALFGQTITGIHIGYLLMHLATVALLVLIARKFLSTTTAVAVGAAYAVLSLSPSVLGLAAHATQFINFCIVSALLLLIKAEESDSFGLTALSGLFFGMAFLMKQHAVFFMPLGFLLIVAARFGQDASRWRPIVLKCGTLAVGAAVPLLAVALWLYREGVFERFWFWTFAYAKAYVSILPLQAGLANARAVFISLFQAAPIVWGLFAIGFFALFFGKVEQRIRLFLEAWLLLAFLSVCPGFYFRQHYFVPLLPIVCLFAGFAEKVNNRLFWNERFSHLLGGLAGLLIIAGCLHSLYLNRQIDFHLNPAQASRAQYGLNPFPESLTVARYIQENTVPHDRIAVLGSEPQIYFYTGLHGATGYIYTYPLMENQPFAKKMQADMMHEIELAKPAFIVFVAVPTSWLIGRDSSLDIFGWFNQFQADWYDAVAVLPITGDVRQPLLFPENGVLPEPGTGTYLRIYKRKQ